MVQHLLHGSLKVKICEIDRIHTGCGFNPLGKNAGSQTLSRRLSSQLTRLVLCRPKIFGSKLYATIDLDKTRVGRSSSIKYKNSNHPWDEPFHIYCAHLVSDIIFTVKYDNPVGATLIGRAYLSVEEIINGQEVDKWVEILDVDHNPIYGQSKIHVKLQFIHVTQDRNWSRGIQSPQFEGVPYTFFNQKQGCRVSLYQDAHVPDDFNPIIQLSEGKYYVPHRCWEDIFDTITNAKHFIYIAGWSVYAKITLIRDPRRQKPGGNISLGELLKKKADEGVRVLMLVWDDRTSVDALKPLRDDGLMATHDDNTEDYFRNTNVHCFLCPRAFSGGRGVVEDFEVSTMFTHHQKTIVGDSEIPGGGSQKRRIVSFVGGIDLCDGRYDTQHHSLFGTLNTAHKYDFHQPNFSGSSISKGGPREPWHDIHCQLEGPVAWDVLYNFEQRWKKRVGDQNLLQTSELDKFIVRASPVTSSEDPETWNVQLFRSIGGGSASYSPEQFDKPADHGLVVAKDNIIDRSIQDAYINAIRRAKNFIYIENQYFLGSSFGWKSSDQIKVEDIGALHLIPKELSLKIVSKIEAGERFTVYVVIPMWPEGIPESESVQAILDWQRRTLEMMYSDIVYALKRKGLNANPREYLTFFCLGNRETKKSGEYVPTGKPEPDTDYSRAQQARRFMIYVHAKMMIVDDEYIIIGSANINQRSMDGGRDTEIAMGGFQPHHLATTQPAKGQIFGFRMALWSEHLGCLEDDFLYPESVECVRRVNQLAEHNWNLYSASTLEDDLPGHLLRYPIEVTNNGDVTTLQGTVFFPDTKARVLGGKSRNLPSILTT